MESTTVSSETNLLFTSDTPTFVEIPPHAPYDVSALVARVGRVGKNFMREYGGRIYTGTQLITKVEINTLAQPATFIEILAAIELKMGKDFITGFGCSPYDLCYIASEQSELLSTGQNTSNVAFLYRGGGLIPGRGDLVKLASGWALVTNSHNELLRKGTLIITSPLHELV